MIVHGNEGAQLPFLLVCQVMRSGLNGESLILDSLSHWRSSSLRAAGLHLQLLQTSLLWSNQYRLNRLSLNHGGNLADFITSRGRFRNIHDQRLSSGGYPFGIYKGYHRRAEWAYIPCVVPHLTCGLVRSMQENS